MFRFKQFTIHQDRCPMKVGTDGVLLGAWVSVGESDLRILDVGTGTGLIALMLAQRTAAEQMPVPAHNSASQIPDCSFAQKIPVFCCSPQISPVDPDSAFLPYEALPLPLVAHSPATHSPAHFSVFAKNSSPQILGIDVDDVSQARENAAASPWGDRVAMIQCPVQEFNPAERFDLIVSNPPYFTESLTCPDPGRTTARHTVCLSFEELRDAALRLLTPAGRLAVVLPDAEAAHFIAVCRTQLTPIRRADVRTTPRHPVRRVLLEVMRDRYLAENPDAIPFPACTELIVGTGAHEEYTPEYRTLTRDFYLKF